MRNFSSTLLKSGFVAVSMMAMVGCSSINLGGSSFGGSPTEIANISDRGILTSQSALMEARNHFKNSDFGYSAAFYKKAAELSPQNPEAYIGLAASYDQLGRFDLSDRVYVSLHRITGDTLQYHNNIGYSYMLRGNLSAALVNFRKAAALAPQNIVIANNLQLLADAAATRA